MSNVFMSYIKEYGLEKFIQDLMLDTKEEDNLILLDYNQIYSPRFSVADACRGIILDKNTLEIVCRPFRRFYNLGEIYNHLPYNLNVDDYIIREKLDGSLIKVYHYNNEWRWATRGTINGNSLDIRYGVVHSTTFEEIVKEALKDLGFDSWDEAAKAHNFNPENTYLFELVSPYNKVVIQYEKPKLYYLSSIVNKTGEYGGDIDWVNKPKSWKFLEDDSMEVVMNTIENGYDTYDEGVVVYDAKTNLPVYKIKTSLYVKLHYIRGNGLTLKKAVEIVADNEQEEYISYFPEDKDIITSIKNIKDSFYIVQSLMIHHIRSINLSKKEVGLLLKPDSEIPAIVQSLIFINNLEESLKRVIMNMAIHTYFALLKNGEKTGNREKEIKEKFLSDWLNNNAGFVAEVYTQINKEQ